MFTPTTPAGSSKDQQIEGPFRIPKGSGSGVRGTMLNAVRPLLESALRFPMCNEMYEEVAKWPDDGRHWVDKALERLSIELEFDESYLARIPAEGPLLVVSNHPFGGLEGMMLASLLRRVRPDVKFFANYILGAIPDMRDLLIFVDPFERPDSIDRNRAGLRESLNWLRDGHVLAAFPSGTVSHLHMKQRAVVDPPWHHTFSRMARKTDAAMLPVFFDGRNSNLFQLAGVVHPRLRTAMLLHEFLRRRNSSVPVRIGQAIPAAKVAAFESAEALTEYCRARTYLLGQASSDKARPAPQMVSSGEPIIEPVDRAQLASEIESLPVDQLLCDGGDMVVYHFAADQAPTAMRELGRLREVAFRSVGEGTGLSCDLDAYDIYYDHLVVWHKTDREVVGSYRMGRSDRIIAARGVEGLYTHKLFDFDDDLMNQIGPALELGRSFVSPAYRKQFAPLMLLWKGIGHFVVKHPEYDKLFGPVSISAEYSSMSRQLLVLGLKMNRSLPALASLLRPRNPPKLRPPRGCDASLISVVARDLDDVNQLIGELEADGKTMPVLLRQYLKLNAVFLGFNVDSDFGDVIDGLMLVDLHKVEPGVLKRYLGKDALTRFGPNRVTA